MSPFDACAIAKLIYGDTLNGELQDVSDSFRRIAGLMNGLPVISRRMAFDAFLCDRLDGASIIESIGNIDPTAPWPVQEAVFRRAAHLGDLSRADSGQDFTWKKWIARRHINLLSSDPKVGKTVTVMDWARRMWFELAWPDGQDPTYPAGTKTLWIPGDRHHDQLKALAASYGMPPEAVLFNADPSDPYGGCTIDEPEDIERLRELVEVERPGLVVIDTIWRATRRKLFREDEVNALLDPIVRIAQECDVAVLGLMHLSKSGETLGRRLEGLARSIITITKPDPEGQPDRRKLEVPRANFKVGPPLGVTIKDGECIYDFEPPEENDAPPKSKGGRPSKERDEACQFIRDALGKLNNQKTTALKQAFMESGGVEGTFWNARKAMLAAKEILLIEGPPQLIYLNPTKEEEKKEAQDAPAF